jgi:hypothetical protein
MPTMHGSCLTRSHQNIVDFFRSSKQEFGAVKWSGPVLSDIGLVLSDIGPAHIHRNTVQRIIQGWQN